VGYDLKQRRKSFNYFTILTKMGQQY
jgi:hypothetical protein